MTNKEFKGLKRTVKKALRNEICQSVFNEACKTNNALMNALTSVLNKNVEHKELSFNWRK